MFKKHQNKLDMIVASQVRQDDMFFARKRTKILLDWVAFNLGAGENPSSTQSKRPKLSASYLSLLCQKNKIKRRVLKKRNLKKPLKKKTIQNGVKIWKKNKAFDFTLKLPNDVIPRITEKMSDEKSPALKLSEVVFEPTWVRRNVVELGQEIDFSPILPAEPPDLSLKANEFVL